MAFSARIDTSPLARNAKRLAQLAETARERVVTRSIATMRRKLLTEARRAISAEYGIGVQAIGNRMTAEVSPNSLSIYGTAGSLPLSWFGGKYSGRMSLGATASVLRGETKLYRSSFIVKGRKNIVRRPMKGDKREPRRYATMWGPGVESMFTGGGAGGRPPVVQVVGLAQDIFSAEIDRLIEVEARN